MLDLLYLLVPVLCVAAFFYGLYLLLLKRGRRMMGAKILFGSIAVLPVMLIVLSLASYHQDAVSAGYLSVDDQAEAIKAGFGDQSAGAWAVERQRLEKLEQETEDKAIADAKAAEVAKKEIQRRKGFHCLSSWDGSHRAVANLVKEAMREPDSYEHVRTLITPVDASGYHTLTMVYRGRNGFGGMTVSTATAKVSQSDCSAQIQSFQ